MTTQEKILNQLQVLETLSKQGAYSDKFVLALRNLIIQEINSIEEEIQEIEIDLQTFEEQYKLSSAQFDQQFKSGELGDEIDFVEWSAFYQMWCSLQERLNILKSQVYC